MLRLLAPLPLVRGLLVLLALAVGLAGMAAVHSVDLAGSTEVVASVENADLLGHSYHHNHDGEPSAPLHNPFDRTHVTLGLPAPPPSILPPASSRIAWLRADPAARSEPRQLDRPPRRSFVA